MALTYEVGALTHEVEVTLSSAKDLKNVNWLHGPIRPYVVLWLDEQINCSTRVDEEGDTCPIWNETLVIPVSAPINDDTRLFVVVRHDSFEKDIKPLIGYAELKLREVLDVVGFDERHETTLQLKRLSGRLQGEVDVKVLITEAFCESPEPIYHAPLHWFTSPASRDDMAALPAFDYSYAQLSPPPNPHNNAAPPADYQYTPYNYNGLPSYDQTLYGEGSEQEEEEKIKTARLETLYGEGSEQEEEEKIKTARLETGLAVDAAAGVLGALSLVEGVDALKNHIEEEMTQMFWDTGSAVDAAAGVLGALPLVEGVDALKNHIEEEMAQMFWDTGSAVDAAAEVLGALSSAEGVDGLKNHIEEEATQILWW